MVVLSHPGVGQAHQREVRLARLQEGQGVVAVEGHKPAVVGAPRKAIEPLSRFRAGHKGKAQHADNATVRHHE